MIGPLLDQLKLLLLCILTTTTFSSCEYVVNGQIKNLTGDTVSVTIVADTDLGKEVNEYNWWDSTIYNNAFRGQGFMNTKVTWLPDKIFKVDFEIYPKDSVRIFGGLGPAGYSKIHFDTLKIKRGDGQELALSGRKAIFDAFEEYNKSIYRFNIK